MLQLHFEHPHGRFRCGQLLAGAHLVEQMAKADDVDILDFRYGTRPHNGIDARTKAQQAVLKAGQSAKGKVKTWNEMNWVRGSWVMEWNRKENA